MSAPLLEVSGLKKHFPLKGGLFGANRGYVYAVDGVSFTVRIQSEDFDASAEVARLSAGRRDIGAVVTFTGLCRDEDGTLAALELEHYPGMAEAEIARVADEALQAAGSLA